MLACKNEEAREMGEQVLISVIYGSLCTLRLPPKPDLKERSQALITHSAHLNTHTN